MDEPITGKHKKPRLRRELSLLQLVIIGVVGALGNGALFGTVGMVALAGPGAIIGFIFGGIIYTSVGFTYMELAKVHPEAGGPTRYSIYTHGRLTNLLNSLADLTWYIFIPPIEAVSIVAGLDYFFHGLLTSQGYPTLTGSLIGLALMLAFVPFNYFGVRRFGNSTKYLGIAKLVFYLAMSFGLIFLVHNWGNLTNYGFVPFGPIGILLAMPLAMYDFGGIRVIPDLAEEAKKPEIIPKAVILTVIFETLIYISVAFAVLLSINWSALGFTPGNFSSVTTGGVNPFFVFAHSNNLQIIFIIAVIAGLMSPFVTGYIYLGSGTRILFAMGRSGFVGDTFKRLHSKYEIPIWSLVAFAVVGAFVVLVSAPLPSIYHLIDYAVDAGYLGFITNPVALMASRRQGVTKKEHMYPGMAVVAPIAMALASLIIFWDGWTSIVYSLSIMLGGSLIFGLVSYFGTTNRDSMHWKNGIWYLGYIAFMVLMIGISSDGLYNYLTFTEGTIVTGLVTALVFYPLGVFSALKESYTHKDYTEAVQKEVAQSPAVE